MFESSWWSIELASGWRADEDSGCVTFSRKDAPAALQISAYKNDDAIVPTDDLRDFTKGEFPDGVTLLPVRYGKFLGSGVDYVADGQFWLKRWLHSGPLLLFVTYNSKAQDCALEANEVNQMISTLKPSEFAALTRRST